MEGEGIFKKRRLPERLRQSAIRADIPKEHWDNPQVREFLSKVADLTDLEVEFGRLSHDSRVDPMLRDRYNATQRLAAAASFMMTIDPKDERYKVTRERLIEITNIALSRFGLKVVDTKEPLQDSAPKNATPKK